MIAVERPGFSGLRPRASRYALVYLAVGLSRKLRAVGCCPDSQVAVLARRQNAPLAEDTDKRRCTDRNREQSLLAAHCLPLCNGRPLDVRSRSNLLRCRHFVNDHLRRAEGARRARTRLPASARRATLGPPRRSPLARRRERHAAPGTRATFVRGGGRIGQDETGLVSERRLRVGLVMQPEGIDNPYNQGAYLGLERAVRELGMRGRVLTRARRKATSRASHCSRDRSTTSSSEQDSLRPPRSTESPQGFPKRGSRSSTSPTTIWRIARRTSWASRSAKSKPVIWPVTWLRLC